MTTCPPAVAEVVAAILQTGILRIRSYAWDGDAAHCAVEADHLHNLPCLLSNYSNDLLRFYWDVERVSFLKGFAPGAATGFEPLWEKLEQLIKYEAVEAGV